VDVSSLYARPAYVGMQTVYSAPYIHIHGGHRINKEFVIGRQTVGILRGSHTRTYAGDLALSMLACPHM
jgi:hypothetical protein